MKRREPCVARMYELGQSSLETSDAVDISPVFTLCTVDVRYIASMPQPTGPLAVTVRDHAWSRPIMRHTAVDTVQRSRHASKLNIGTTVVPQIWSRISP